MTQVNWHDFAFFDPVMYESLRQLIRHSQTSEAEAVFAAMDLAFAIDLCKEEGSGQVRLFCSKAPSAKAFTRPVLVFNLVNN